MTRPALIVSGGQTGADRAALDVAIAIGIAHNGYCPAGRKAEDGRIPDQYNLRETRERGYEERTARNVKHSDATLIVSRDAVLRSGSLLTKSLAEAHGKPVLHVQPQDPRAVEIVRRWLVTHQPKILNVAGQRESKAPGIGAETRALLRAVLCRGGSD